VEVGAQRLAHPLLLIAQQIVEFLLRDLVAADGCHRLRAVAAIDVVIDAEERERKRDQREDALRDVLVLVDEIEHGGVIGKVRLRSPGITKKGELAFAPRWCWR